MDGLAERVLDLENSQVEYINMLEDLVETKRQRVTACDDLAVL